MILQKESVIDSFFIYGKKVQRYLEILDATVQKEIEPVINALGYLLVEVKVIKTKTSSGVRVVIYRRQQPIGLKDCEIVAQQIYPQLELIEELGNFELEVSSPGIGRELKNKGDYLIFYGCLIKYLLEGESDWRQGIISNLNGEELVLKEENEEIKIPLNKIRRVKLA